MEEKNDDKWMSRIEGFLLDITGVLYNSGPNGGLAIDGSVETVKKLYDDGYPVRFVSNESTSMRETLVSRLRRLGFDALAVGDVLTPAPLAVRYLRTHRLRPHLLVHPDVVGEFSELYESSAFNYAEPNCVVVGDAEEEFTYENMNAAFRVLMSSADPLLISLGCGRFYQRVDGPALDVGAFAMALKYATNCRHVVIGKPTEEYFASAVNDMGLRREQVVMIGDDLHSDIAGAQAIGIRGVQVRTGKWRCEWENHQHVKPDLIADDFRTAISTIMAHSDRKKN